MYVLVDLDKCIFCHAHPDHSVIAALAHIEVAHCAVSIFPSERAVDFPDFTDLEMRLLYQNTTGHKFEGFSHLHLRELTLEAARRLPESDVVVSEVKAQAEKIAFTEQGFYRYVKGARTAARLQTLHIIPAKVATGQPKAEQGHEPVVVQATPPKPAAPRGGARAVIWEVADKMWAEQDYPRQPAAILTLRKQIMQELEDLHEIKRSTSSTALGEWQKVRLAG